MSRNAAKLLTVLRGLTADQVTLEDLAEAARLTPFKTRQALAELEEHGYLVVVRHG